jgi:hypothetical protein
MRRKQRRVINRSGTCECDICGEPNILEQHHIRGRSIPNANHPSNIANICSNCHTKVHHGIIVIESWLMTTGGAELMWHHYKDESFTGDDAKPYII